MRGKRNQRHFPGFQAFSKPVNQCSERPSNGRFLTLQPPLEVDELALPGQIAVCWHPGGGNKGSGLSTRIELRYSGVRKEERKRLNEDGDSRPLFDAQNGGGNIPPLSYAGISRVKVQGGKDQSSRIC